MKINFFKSLSFLWKGGQANSTKISFLSQFKNIQDYSFFPTDKKVGLTLSSYCMVPPAFCSVHLVCVLSPL